MTYTKYGGMNGPDPGDGYSYFRKAMKRIMIGLEQPPIVFVHGFDSSSVEFRRLAPILERMGQEVYCIDVLGWGFGNVENVNEFTPQAKVDHLESFLRQIVGKKCILGGASLGGAIAINLYEQAPDLISKLVLIDAQGFIDGDGPKNIPNFLAGIGIEILRSKSLRMFANYIAYADKSLATTDAMLIGRLHCSLKSWKRSSIEFLKSGGFVTSEKVAKVKIPTLVLWGSNDEILDPSTAERFGEELQYGIVKYISDCGHVCHLEKPQETAEEIINFMEVNVHTEK